MSRDASWLCCRDVNLTIYKSFRNIPGVEVRVAPAFSVKDVLEADHRHHGPGRTGHAGSRLGNKRPENRAEQEAASLMSATTKSPYEIIVRPIVTEKTVAGGEQGKYTFIVAKDANKYEIALAIEKIQADAKNIINVSAVNTLVVKGKAAAGPLLQACQPGAHVRLEESHCDPAAGPADRTGRGSSNLMGNQTL